MWGLDFAPARRMFGVTYPSGTEMGTDSLIGAALAIWPELAAQIGARPQEWEPRRLAFREDARVSRILLRLDRPGAAPLVLKHEARPVRPEVFCKAVEAHLAAFEAFPEGVPELLATEVGRQALVMRLVEGRPLSVLLDGADSAQQCALLRRTGAWLSRFHAGFQGTPRVFQPKFTLNFLRQVLADLERGDRAVLEPARFRRAAEELCAAQGAFEGRVTQAAVTHGDLHMRNVLVGKTRVWGIDFAGDRVVPVGHDIGRLLADVAILRADHARVRPGQVLPDDALAAFFEGYDLVGPDDPSVRLLLRHRVLAEWWGLPVAGLTPAQARRWQGISSLAARVFPGG